MLAAQAVSEADDLHSRRDVFGRLGRRDGRGFLEGEKACLPCFFGSADNPDVSSISFGCVGKRCCSARPKDGDACASLLQDAGHVASNKCRKLHGLRGTNADKLDNLDALLVLKSSSKSCLAGSSSRNRNGNKRADKRYSSFGRSVVIRRRAFSVFDLLAQIIAAKSGPLERTGVVGLDGDEAVGPLNGAVHQIEVVGDQFAAGDDARPDGRRGVGVEFRAGLRLLRDGSNVGDLHIDQPGDLLLRALGGEDEAGGVPRSGADDGGGHGGLGVDEGCLRKFLVDLGKVSFDFVPDVFNIYLHGGLAAASALLLAHGFFFGGSLFWSL